MPICADVKNALKLLLGGEWSEFIFRMRVYLGQVDLSTAHLKELNLSEERCHFYDNSGGLQLQAILKMLKISDQDSILDFGSGKGGALFTFSKFPFRRIAGCELSPQLVEIARKNLRLMNVRNVEIFEADAADFREIDDFNYFYFFNPFPCSVLSSVVGNIHSSLLKRPREITILYLNPEYHEVIDESPHLKKTNELKFCEMKIFIYKNTKALPHIEGIPEL